MSHFVVIRFDTEEEANAFAYAQKEVQAETMSADMYNFGHMHDDVFLVVNEQMGLSDEDKAKVDIAAIVEKLFDYDYSRYNEYIAALVNEQLEEEASA